MSKIPESYLPPREYIPRKVNLLSEIKYPEKLNLARFLLDHNLEKRADKVAIFFQDQRITYQEFHNLANRFANGLRELGVEKEDRVMLRSANIPEFLIWNFACWRIGAIPVMINHMDRSDQVEYKANDSEAVAVCVHSDWCGDVLKIRSNCPNLKHIIVAGKAIPGAVSYEDLIKTQADRADSEEVGIGEIGRLLYSSGTTGKPKGSIMTNQDLLLAPDIMGRYIYKVREDDVVGGNAFFTYAMGALIFVLVPWRFGASLSVIERFTPVDMLQVIQDHGITVLQGTPTMFRMMLAIENAEKQYDCKSLRLGSSGGESLPASTYLDFKRRFGVEIINGLGCGELHCWLSTPPGIPRSKIGSTGVDIPGYKSVIVDESLKEVPPGTLGEMLVLGPTGQQYWRRPDLQKKGVVWQESEFKGWNRPGLLATKDKDGYFWLRGRSDDDDMLVTAGYKILAEDIERALNEHPAVLESAVVETPDKDRVSIIKAFVVLAQTGKPSEDLAKELQQHVKSQIEMYKYPRIIEFVKAEDLPRTASGKIIRKKLREMERQRQEL